MAPVEGVLSLIEGLELPTGEEGESGARLVG